jgi:hypothetical protein
MKSVVRRIVVAWMLVVGVFAWLPLLRSVFDGWSYSWGFSLLGIPLRGDGLGGDFWYLPLKAAFLAVTVYALLRCWRPVGAILATAWTALIVADNVRAYLEDPAGLVLRGDTLGININLSLFAPIFSGILLMACLLYWRGSVSSGPQRPIPLQALNVKRLLSLAALLPLQFVLLRFGEPHGLSDQAGVILTILQWLLLGWALRHSE